EAVHRRQVFVAVAEVVLAQLRGRVAQWFEQFGDGRVFLVQTNRRGRKPDFGQPGAQSVLTGDERRPSGGATLLGIVIGEQHALIGDAVDVWGLVAHEPTRVAAEVGHADVIAPDDDDVRLVRWLRHRNLLSLIGGFESAYGSPLLDCTIKRVAAARQRRRRGL